MFQSKTKPKRVKAIYNCVADNPDELTFSEGDIIVVDGEEDQEWWVSILHFPSTYFERNKWNLEVDTDFRSPVGFSNNKKSFISCKPDSRNFFCSKIKLQVSFFSFKKKKNLITRVHNIQGTWSV